jgi:hypothetical protein
MDIAFATTSLRVLAAVDEYALTLVACFAIVGSTSR